MKIFVNGEEREVSNALTAQQLVETLDLGGKRVAMEINREIVPRSTYPEHVLQEGDHVEIVRAIGGG